MLLLSSCFSLQNSSCIHTRTCRKYFRDSWISCCSYVEERDVQLMSVLHVDVGCKQTQSPHAGGHRIILCTTIQLSRTYYTNLVHIWVYSSLPYLRYCFFSFQAVLSTAWGKLLLACLWLACPGDMFRQYESSPTFVSSDGIFLVLLTS